MKGGMSKKGSVAKKVLLQKFLSSLKRNVLMTKLLSLDDLLSRPLLKERQTGALVDREGITRVVFDIDGWDT